MTRTLISVLSLLLLFSFRPAQADEEHLPTPARLKVSGHGLLGNRDLKRTLRLLLPTAERKPVLYDSTFVEDGALIIISKLTHEGYLAPRLRATLILADGSKQRYEWDKGLSTYLPRPLALKMVSFRVNPGVLFYYDQLEFRGLGPIKESKARAFFLETEGLIPLKRTRTYTPSLLEDSMANLKDTYARMGYQEAVVTATNLLRNDRSGAVSVLIDVTLGLPTWVRSVSTEMTGPSNTVATIKTNRIHVPYSRYWGQDFLQGLRTNQYQRGFPDATAEMRVLQREVLATNVVVDLAARVTPGRLIEIGEVLFEGRQRTQLSILQDRVDLEEATPLNRIAVERGRFRISRLGVFNSVGVRYDLVDDDTRDVVYELREGKTIDFSLLFGYGSYEMLRGGFELSQHNLWGRAHQARFRVTQSFRSTSADYLYTMPETFHGDVNLFLTASGLRREEVSFVREEYGGSVGAQRFVTSLQSDISLRYNYEFLNARDQDLILEEGVDRATVSSLVLDLKHDRRDNPLLPRKGYKIFTTLEFASASLGGEVDYQRVEVATSFHHKIGRGQYLSLGLTHGAVTTFGGNEQDLPFNKRFFPGGENSVRGFQQGEAAPLDPHGDVVGAETYTQGNVELEQLLTPAWSLVAFVDGVGFARRMSHYPAAEFLVSAGGGIRWKTLIGPARLEYGYNLNPRRKDPVGTLHFSLGFPF